MESVTGTFRSEKKYENAKRRFIELHSLENGKKKKKGKRFPGINIQLKINWAFRFEYNPNARQFVEDFFFRIFLQRESFVVPILFAQFLN